MIHKFQLEGTKIVLDVNSGAVHVMDDPAWEIVDDFPAAGREVVLAKYGTRYPAAVIEEVLNEISCLQAEGLLFSNDRYGDSGYPAGQRVSGDAAEDLSSGSAVVCPPGDEPPVVKSICLNVSHDCNLRCRYCFAGSGRFGGQKALMSVETGRQAIDFLLANSAGRHSCELDFFGGEPLLNIETVRKLVSYGKARAAAKNKEINFTLTTNALLLDDKTRDFLNREKIKVVLSLDGRPAVHDAMRVAGESGRGSYAEVKPKISALVASRNNENYYIRGTYTRRNLDFSRDVLHLADLGYKYISVEPVVGTSADDWSLRAGDLPEIFRQYELLVGEYVKRRNEGRPFEFFHFNLDLNNGPCLPKRLSGCGAGYEYMAVTPEGDLYPCHQFVGRDRFRLGHVRDGICNPDLVFQFRKAHVYNKDKCRRCWAKFHCGGGCHANAELINATIMEPDRVGCEIERKRLECAIYIQVLKSGNNEI